MHQGYESLDLESRPDGVPLVRIRSRQPGQAANRSLHQEMEHLAGHSRGP